MIQRNLNKERRLTQLKCLPIRGGSRGGYVYEVNFAGVSCRVNLAFAAWMMQQGAR